MDPRAAAEPKAGWRVWLALWGLAVPVFVTITLSPLLNGAAMDARGLSSVSIGIARTAEILTNALVALTLAPRLARADARLLGLAGMALLGLGNLGGLMGNGFWDLALARVVAGLGAGLSTAAGAMLLARTKSPHRVAAGLSIPVTIFTVAAAASGGRLTEAYGQVGVFGLIAACAAFGIFLAFLAPGRVKGAPAPPPALRGVAQSLRSPYVLASAAVFLGSSAVWQFFERKALSVGLAHAQIGDLIAVCSIGAGLFAAAGALVRDRWVRTAALTAMTAFAVGTVLTPLAPVAAAFTAAYALQAMAYPLTSNFMNAVGLRLDRTGGMVAAGNGASAFANAFAPTIGGALLLGGSFAPLAILAALGGLTAIVLMALAARAAGPSSHPAAIEPSPAAAAPKQ